MVRTHIEYDDFGEYTESLEDLGISLLIRGYSKRWVL